MKIFLLIICCSTRLMGQFEFNIENSNNLRKENCKFNPTKIIEVRIQKDSLKNEYVAWTIETIFRNNRVSKYSMTSKNHKYIENYFWESDVNGNKLIRYDSTFYFDTTNLYRSGANLSNRINHQDTFVLIFSENGKLINKKGNSKIGGNSYQYDDSGNLILANSFNHKDSITYSKSWKHIYDDDGRIQESNLYSSIELTDYYRFFYDNQLEKKVRVSFSYGNLVALKIINDYYNHEHQLEKRIEEHSEAGFGKTSKREIFYNEQGDIVFETGSTLMLDELYLLNLRYEYKYDDKNNWIECIAYFEPKDDKGYNWSYKTIRTIEYK